MVELFQTRKDQASGEGKTKQEKQKLRKQSEPHLSCHFSLPDHSQQALATFFLPCNPIISLFKFKGNLLQ